MSWCRVNEALFVMIFLLDISGGIRISQREAPTPEFQAKNLLFDKLFVENYMKMKEVGPREASLAPLWIRQ